MTWFIYLFSTVWIACGVFLILYTEQSRETMEKALGRMGRLPAAATAGIIGLLLIIAARGSHNSAVIMLIGLLAMAKGAVFFWNPNDLYAKTLKWWLEEAADQTFRLTGIIAIVLGTALFSWA
jgi:hypothetical protein